MLSKQRATEHHFLSRLQSTGTSHFSSVTCFYKSDVLYENAHQSLFPIIWEGENYIVLHINSKSWINFLKHNRNIAKHLYEIKRLILGRKVFKTFRPDPRAFMWSLYTAALGAATSPLPVSCFLSPAFLSFPSFSSKLSPMLGNLTNTKQKSGKWSKAYGREYVQGKGTTGREWLTHCLFKMMHWVWGYRYNFFSKTHTWPEKYLIFFPFSFPFPLPSGFFQSNWFYKMWVWLLMGSRICCCRIRIILSWKHLKISRCRKRLSLCSPCLPKCRAL